MTPNTFGVLMIISAGIVVAFGVARLVRRERRRRREPDF